MLQLSQSLINLPVMSLRTGGLVATAIKLVINPNNLKIEGWHCTDMFSKKSLILLVKDVRDIVPQGLAIDDFDRLTESTELVRLQEILEINFDLYGKHVVTDTKRKIGKVNDFAVDTSSFTIQKLYVSQPVYRSISGGQLSIDRSQIIEITNHQITVRDADIRVGSAVPSFSQA